MAEIATSSVTDDCDAVGFGSFAGGSWKRGGQGGGSDGGCEKVAASHDEYGEETVSVGGCLHGS